MNDLVSVIVPVYNSEQYIDETIQSITAQSYENIEIILVDDGSADGSILRCREWEKRDERVRVYQIANSGPSAARNYAISKATGRYILPVDSDDLIDKTYVEKAAAVLEENPDIGIVYCKARLFGDKNQEWKLSPYSMKQILTANCIFSSAMFRKEDWEATGGYSKEMIYGEEDYEFWLSIISLGREVYQISEVLFFYRIHSKSRTDYYMQNEAKPEQMAFKKFLLHEDLYRKYYNLFDKNTRIALYGAGVAGRNYNRCVKTLESGNVVLWVDANPNKINGNGTDLPVNNIGSLKLDNYDVIVIAINDNVVVDEVKRFIQEHINTNKKVIWYIKENLQNPIG